MGTPDFAVPSLTALVENTEVAAVVTQPDKPKGRSKKPVPSPVKIFAEKNNIPVYQPQRLKGDEETAAALAKCDADLFVIAAFGQILPKNILDMPRIGCINVHASLLPRHRGAAPIERAIMAGETKTGVTIMMMNEGLDTGDILLQAETAITNDMTGGELRDELGAIGAKLLAEALEKFADGTIVRRKQDDAASNYAPMITKETGLIDWTKSAAEIHNLVRALDPHWSAYTFLDGEKYKINRTRTVETADKNQKPGSVIRADKKGLVVAAGENAVEITELTPAGKKRMSALSFINGRAMPPGTTFGA